jgi:hypothetical protein
VSQTVTPAVSGTVSSQTDTSSHGS